MTDVDAERLRRLAQAMATVRKREEAGRLEQSFQEFCREAWPILEPGRELVWNWHLDAIAEHLQAVLRGELLRLVINVPPRHMKSLQTNVFMPCWAWTTRPHLQFLSISHSEKLAVRDAVKSRNILTSRWYQERWGASFKITSDQNEKSRYVNDKNGHRIALGINARITGEGGDILVIDDPHDAEQAQSDAERTNVIEKFDDTLTSRLNDQRTGAIVIIMQRLHEKDLAGHVLAKGGYEHLCLPTEYDPKHPYRSVHDMRTKPGELLWPERFPDTVVEATKRDLTTYAYSGQHQQIPTPTTGGILKRSWWKRWGKGEPPPFLTDEQRECWASAAPPVTYILQTWDCAFSAKETADYSACTTWGVWIDRRGVAHAIMLGAAKGRWEYPELRREAQERHRKHKPSVVLIEAKASGQSLIQDLQRANVPVIPYNPGSRDKVARAHVASPLLEGGRVWAPQRDWADAVIEECVKFPGGEHDDYVDTVTMAIHRIQEGRFVEHPDDDQEDEGNVVPFKRRGSSYGR